MYGKGYIYGLGLAFLLWLLIKHVDKRYYKKKRELLTKRLKKKEESSLTSQCKELSKDRISE